MNGRSLCMISAVAALLLPACDRGRNAPEEANVISQGPAEVEREGKGGSIIREDVLNETDVPAPPAEAQPVQLTLDFAEAEGKLPAPAAAKLQSLLDAPLVAQGGCIIVRAHTDSRGSDEDNLRVSERRAAMVGDYLVEQGIARERLWLIALGERRPIAPNAHPDGSDYPEGRAKNRRVTVDAQPKGEGVEQCGGGGEGEA